MAGQPAAGHLPNTCILRLDSACMCVQVVNDPGSIPRLIGTALPTSSNFFINYMVLQGFTMIPFRMMFQYMGFLVQLFRLMGCCCTPACSALPGTADGLVFLLADASAAGGLSVDVQRSRDSPLCCVPVMP